MPTCPVRFPDSISGFRSIAINGLAMVVRSLFPIDSADIKWEWSAQGLSAKVTRRDMDKPGYPWDKIVNGYVLDAGNNRIRIVNPELHWSDHGFFTASDTNVTIPGGDGLYYVGMTFDGTTLSITTTAVTDKTTFTSDSSIFRTWLYGVTRVGTSLSVTKIGHMGIIELDASLG